MIQELIINGFIVGVLWFKLPFDTSIKHSVQCYEVLVGLGNKKSPPPFLFLRRGIIGFLQKITPPFTHTGEIANLAFLSVFFSALVRLMVV